MSSRAGFTLIELLVGLTLMGLLLLGLRAMLDALVITDERIALRAHSAERDGIGYRLLIDAAARARRTTATTAQFDGDASSIRFPSRCESAGGWLEYCVVRLRIAPSRDTMWVWGSFVTPVEVPLFHGRTLEFRFLDRSAPAGVWIREWGSAIDTPLAFAIVHGNDTLIIPVGQAQ